MQLLWNTTWTFSTQKEIEDNGVREFVTDKPPAVAQRAV